MVNLTTEELLRRLPGRYPILRYEDFIDNPRGAIGHIVDLVEESVPHLPLMSGNRVEPKPNHTISGNPSRFRSGLVELLLDDEWKTKMNLLAQRNRNDNDLAVAFEI